MNTLTRFLLIISGCVCASAAADEVSVARAELKRAEPQKAEILQAACAVQDPWLRRCLLDYALALHASDAAALQEARALLAGKAPDYEASRVELILQDPSPARRRSLAALALIDVEETQSGRRPSQMAITQAAPAELNIPSPVAALAKAAPVPAVTEKAADPIADLQRSVQEMSQKLQSGDESVLPRLAAAAPQVKSRALAGALVKISLLAKLRSPDQKAAYDATVKQFQGVFNGKDLNRHFAFLQGELFFEACASCSASGKVESKCKAGCKEGACTSSKCEGGEISYRGAGGDSIHKKCPVCQGSAKCPRCQGSGKGESNCGKCSGKGQRRTLAKVPELYAAALTELCSLSDEVAAKGYSSQDSLPDPVLPAAKKPDLVAAKAPATAELKPAPAGSLVPKLMPKLVNRDGKKPDAKALGKPQYVAYYFSASWCGPCRAFSPKLIAEYEALKKGGVQVILAGCDSDKDSMLAYMNTKDHPQPWPGLCRQDQGAFGFDAYGISGIPAMVIVDSNGAVVAKGYAEMMLMKAKELAAGK
ncbi:MAG: hypothetical protein RL095_790 [Verrucomicrobiota bacterium]|jgi:thiol-disulfide isomerase/thioredoxin